jgi:Holliday junction DNA helicase RuvA
MIAKLTGLLDSVFNGIAIIDVNGVGYQVYASPRTMSQIGDKGDQVSLLIDTNVREDAITLYGFIDAVEQHWFRLLISVQGVGAKAAMAILGVCSPDKLTLSIASGDSQALRAADGVGPKLATRIVTELKDKATAMDLQQTVSAATLASPADQDDGTSHNATVDQDAVSALMHLGYGRSDAYAAVIKVQGKSNDNLPLEAVIKEALKELGS